MKGINCKMYLLILLMNFSLVSLAQSSINMEQLDKQGHRGCRGLYPENTIPGFLKAIDLGATTLEMDLVITKDKKVILSLNSLQLLVDRLTCQIGGQALLKGAFSQPFGLLKSALRYHRF